MRVVVVGLGIQGRKRLAIAGDDAVATVDPVAEGATVTSIDQLDPATYDAALVCTPDGVKPPLLDGLLRGGKHVLVEKPLRTINGVGPRELAAAATAGGATLYTAYNHRFEPHIVALRDHLATGALGDVHRVRLAYGNGTARDVRSSPWRDKGSGVLDDLGSHLLDMLLFLVGDVPADLDVWASRRFENAAPDHVVCGSGGTPLIELSMSLLSWRNEFRADVVGDRGSAHIDSLCKWGPTTFTTRTRVLPSGRPPEDVVTLETADPTWEAEYRHFTELSAGPPSYDVDRDRVIDETLDRLGARA
jgi:predicted dehydrogenase